MTASTLAHGALTRADSTPSASPAPNYATFPGAGVKIIKPDGFEVSKNFQGIAQESAGASVVVSFVPAPLAETTAGFTADRLAENGMKLINRERVEVDGRKGLLFHVTQVALGIEFTKWMLVAGDASNTNLVVASFPASESPKFSKTLRETVLSARFIGELGPERHADVGFTVVPLKKLRLNPRTRGVGHMLLYSINTVPKSPGEPMFTATRSHGPLIGFEREQFATHRIKDLGKVRGTNIKSKKKVRIDGLPGFEVIADGEDIETGAPLVVYETILFLEDDYYYLMIGTVGASQASGYVPAFRKMAQSFKRSR